MGEIVEQTPQVDIKPSQNHWLPKISAAAALLTGIMMLFALISLVAGKSILSSFENNWLVILFKINAGYEGFSFDRLQGIHILDVAILVLAGITYLGIANITQRAGKIWAVIGAALPFIGIGILFITKLAGRSAVMGGGLIIACVMWCNKAFGKGIALVGIIANVLLLMGDFGANPASTIYAIAVAVGYLLLMFWFFLIARRLFQIR
jgi:hypothetical protein